MGLELCDELEWIMFDSRCSEMHEMLFLSKME